MARVTGGQQLPGARLGGDGLLLLELRQVVRTGRVQRGERGGGVRTSAEENTASLVGEGERERNE